MVKTASIFLLVSLVFINLQAQYNVRDFGAKGDGTSLDTRSIQSAVDKANQDNGGIVSLPPGVYKIGTIILKDNVELYLSPGAVLSGSSDYRDYLPVDQKLESRAKNLYAKYFMIFAEGASNVSITGKGEIYGNGLDNFRQERPQNLRPVMIRLVSCRNITIRDIRLSESANWTLHLLCCTDVNITGIDIKTTAEGNRDGLDIDACQRVFVSNSRFSTTDDAIVMKNTNDVLCQDIVITNCVLSSGGSAIKTGTESNGGFKNINVSNCVIKNIPVHAGIELMTVDGGMMQNIVFQNITMEDVATPFFIRLGIRLRPYKTGQYVNHVDEVKDISLNNISVLNARLPSSIIGLHNQKIKNISVNGYSVRYKATQEAVGYNKVPFEEFEYPAAVMFSNLPAYGLYCRSVEGLHLQNMHFYPSQNEKRAAVTLDRVVNSDLYAVTEDAEKAGGPVVYCRHAENISAAYCKSVNKGSVLFGTEKNSVLNINLSGNILLPGQQESRNADYLPDDKIFDDFKTDIEYNISGSEKYQGLESADLGSMPLHVKLGTRKGALQLCLLVLNESMIPGKIVLKYNGISQDFMVNWHNWGWAPVSLLAQFDKAGTADFEITAPGEKSHLKISKVWLRYQDIGFTD